MTLRRRSVRSLAALALLAVAGCASEPDPYVERPVHVLYNQAMNAMKERRFLDAARAFDEVERQHPYSEWAIKAQVMAGHSLYEARRYDEAVVALERFIQLHPSHRDTPYAYYLKALSNYEQITDVSRDQAMTRDAMNGFREVMARFPTSEYARDARIKIDLTHDHLAGKEMTIGRWYLRQGHYLASINRFKAVLETYQTTSHVPEALHRLVEGYMALGLTEEAQKVAAVLGHNFPGSEWYIDTYELVEGRPVRPRDEKPWYKVW